MEENSKKIIKLLRRGIKFAPTQPDINRIEKMMVDDIEKGTRLIKKESLNDLQEEIQMMHQEDNNQGKDHGK